MIQFHDPRSKVTYRVSFGVPRWAVHLDPNPLPVWSISPWIGVLAPPERDEVFRTTSYAEARRLLHDEEFRAVFLVMGR